MCFHNVLTALTLPIVMIQLTSPVSACTNLTRRDVKVQCSLEINIRLAFETSIIGGRELQFNAHLEHTVLNLFYRVSKWDLHHPWSSM